MDNRNDITAPKQKMEIENLERDISNESEKESETKIEKKTEELEEKIERKETEPKKINKEKFFAILGIVLICLIILVVLFAIFYNPEKDNKFEYEGFSFEKIPFGGIYVYETNITLLKDDKFVDYNIRLRNDPRKLKDIPVDFPFITKEIYFSFTPETLNCSGDALIAAFQVGQYLGNFGILVNPAVTENFSNNTLPVRNCSSENTTKSIVVLKPFSNETKIYWKENNSKCIILETKNCGVIGVSERFILIFLEKSKKAGSFFKN